MTHCQMFFYLTNDEPFKHRLLLITRNSATQPGCVIEYKSLNSANLGGGFPFKHGYQEEQSPLLEQIQTVFT